MQGTVKPSKHFNPEKDAALLHANLRGLATDSSSGQIIHILSQRSNAQRIEISLSYRELYDRDLIQDVKSGGTGDFQQAVVALLLPPAEYDATSLYKAMKGVITDGKVLMEILLTRTQQEIQAIKGTYRTKYHRDLLVDIGENVSGDFRKLLVKIATDSPDENDKTVSRETARKDADTLRNFSSSTEQQDSHVNHNAILAVFCTRNFQQLGAALACYRQLYPDHNIKKKISTEFNGDLKEALKSVIKLVEKNTDFFAEKLYHSMKGVGTDDETLVRIIVTRAEIDLFDIKERFQQMYGKTLIKYIEGDTSGSYRKLLIAIVGQ